jgi:hypothetical protein
LPALIVPLRIDKVHKSIIHAKIHTSAIFETLKNKPFLTKLSHGMDFRTFWAAGMGSYEQEGARSSYICLRSTFRSGRQEEATGSVPMAFTQRLGSEFVSRDELHAPADRSYCHGRRLSDFFRYESQQSLHIHPDC